MLTSSIYGLIGRSTLFIGALIGLYLAVPRYISALIMSFGSGVLVPALTFDLMERIFQTGSFYSVAIGFIVVTVLFVVGDYQAFIVSLMQNKAIFNPMLLNV